MHLRSAFREWFYSSACPDQKAGVVELQIGYHLLEGKIIALKKPLAVLEKESDPGPPEGFNAEPHQLANGINGFQGGYKVRPAWSYPH